MATCKKVDKSYLTELLQPTKSIKETKGISRQEIINENINENSCDLKTGGGRSNQHIINIKLSARDSFKANKALMEYKKTNNGILYFENNLKKGGNAVFHDQITVDDAYYEAEDRVDDINKYNRNINHTNLIRELKQIYEQEDKTIYKNIDNFYMKNLIYEDDYDSESKTMPIKLQKALECNSQGAGKILTITHDYDRKYEYDKLLKAPVFSKKEDVQLDFRCHAYNFGVVTAYEKYYYDNFTNLQNFLQEQYDFIAKMSITDKIIINDYTKKYAFQLYTTYIWAGDNITNGTWLSDNYKRDIDKKNTGDIETNSNYDDTFTEFGFGDSFYKQIFDVIGAEEFNNIIGHDKKYKSIADYWDTNAKRVECTEKSKFADKLTADLWAKVIDKFIEDISEILSQAPAPKTEIYCYRGVSDHYVRNCKETKIIQLSPTTGVTSEVKHFTNLRFGSFSINYNSSRRYATNSDKNKNGNMYRVTILPGVRVLYIASLSFASDEFELLHNRFGVFAALVGGIQKCYNNKDNKFGILSHDADSFDNVDIVFNGYTDVQITTTDANGQITLLNSIMNDDKNKINAEILNKYKKIQE